MQRDIPAFCSNCNQVVTVSGVEIIVNQPTDHNFHKWHGQDGNGHRIEFYGKAEMLNGTPFVIRTEGFCPTCKVNKRVNVFGTLDNEASKYEAEDDLSHRFLYP